MPVSDGEDASGDEDVSSGLDELSADAVPVPASTDDVERAGSLEQLCAPNSRSTNMLQSITFMADSRSHGCYVTAHDDCDVSVTGVQSWMGHSEPRGRSTVLARCGL